MSRIRFTTGGVFGSRFISTWMRDGEPNSGSELLVLVLKMTKLRQGSGPMDRAYLPFSFYVDARLALTSSLPQDRQLPRLPNDLWIHIFSFYDESRFVQCDTRRPMYRSIKKNVTGNSNKPAPVLIK